MSYQRERRGEEGRVMRGCEGIDDGVGVRKSIVLDI